MDRHKRKNGKEDLLKALHHLEKYIEVAYPEPKYLILGEEKTVVSQVPGTLTKTDHQTATMSLAAVPVA